MRHFIIGLILLLSNHSLYSQQDEAGWKEFYKFGVFDAALPLLLEELKTDPGSADIQYKIAICYLNTNIDKKKAIPYLEYALENGIKENGAVLELAEAYMHAERFDDAIKKLENYKILESKNPENISIADKFISFCKNGKQLKANALDVKLINLGDRVNSERADYMPQMDFKEQTMVFGTDRRYIAEFTEFVNDIYITEYKYGRWKRGKSISSKINSIDHEYLAGTAPDLDAVLIRPDTYDNSGDLFISIRSDKRFGNPEKIKGFVNGEKSIEHSGCLSTSGDTLYFSSDREGGYGGFDLYYSVRIGDDWGVPQNLGESINTPYNECYPNISPDSRKLYFASEGHNSMGGYDIFVAEINYATNNWYKPKNIGYPINSTYDDYNISMSQDGRNAYISAVRDEGYGDYDIYRVVFNDKDPHILTYTGLVALGDTANFTKMSELVSNLDFKVEDEHGDKFGEYSLNSNSFYVVALPPGKYTLKINAGEYGTFEKKIVVAEEKHLHPVIREDIFFATLQQKKK